MSMLATSGRSRRQVSPRPRPRSLRRRLRMARLRPLIALLLAAWLAPVPLAFGQTAPAAAPAPRTVNLNLPPPPALTLPVGGVVRSGQGRIVEPAAGQMRIEQGSATLGLDWQAFSIGSGASVQFVQPDANSIALNRIVGHEASQIYGRLAANGQVFLVNPNGVLFARGAKVDVGGLVASTLDLSQQDFAAGTYRFAGGSSAPVVNDGDLRATSGGYVALFGRDVANTGEIRVDAGTVLLASGEAATVSLSGHGLISAAVTPGSVAGQVLNGGDLLADGGTVRMQAHSAQALAGSLVNNSGLVRANAIVERGGEVWITGDHAATTGRIEANGAGAGDAGRVVVMGDLGRGSVQVAGRIDAQSPGSGQGGQVETSAAQVSIDGDTRVSTLAGTGRHGTWTIDPFDFTVSAGAGAQGLSGIGASTLSSNLQLGNVTLAAAASDGQGNAGTQPGDIKILAPVSWTASTTLTLTALRHIDIDSVITASGNNAGLVLNPGAGGSHRLGVGGKVRLLGSAPTLSIGGLGYTVVNSLAGLDAIRASNVTLQGRYALVTDVDATATANTNGGLGFVPIGNGNGVFRGRFDGLGNSIFGLSIRRPDENNVGLFGYAILATISNLTMVLPDIVGGSGYVGGIVGRMDRALGFTNLRVTGGRVAAVSPDSSSIFIGGIAGYAYAESSLTATLFSSTTVSGDGNSIFAGGLIGYSDTQLGLSGSVSESDVRVGSSAVNNSYAGGLIGYATRTTGISGSRNDGPVSGGFYSGGLVGYYVGDSGIDTSASTGRVSATGYAGGLVGYMQYRGIANSSSSGDVVVTGTNGYGGGLVGYHQSYYADSGINDSRASGNVSSTGSSVELGGLVGYYYSTVPDINTRNTGITNSQASGNVNGRSYAGGLVGHFYDINAAAGGGIANSSATGDVAGRIAVGGLVGRYLGYDPIDSSSASGTVSRSISASGTVYLGGLVGQLQNFATDDTGGVQRSYADGAVVLGGDSTRVVSGENLRAGGLIGYADSSNLRTRLSVRDSYSSASVTLVPTVLDGNVSAAGLISDSGVSISNSYASNTIQAAAGNRVTLGGLVTRTIGSGAAPTAVGSFWNTSTSNINISAQGSARTGSQLQQAATFTGWDLASAAGSSAIWRLYEGRTTPLLRGFLTPLSLNLANASKTYDGSNSFGDAVVVGANGPVQNPERILADFGSVDVGARNVTAANLWSTQDGYDIAAAGSATLTIVPRPLTLDGVVAPKVYDGNTTATLLAGGQPQGLVPGEDLGVNLANVVATFADKRVGGEKEVTVTGYAIADGARGKASNYSIPASSLTFSAILPKSVTVGSFQAVPRTYDGTQTVQVTVTPGNTIEGVIAGDQVGVSLAGADVGVMLDRNAGTAKPVLVSGAQLTGADALNYSIAGLDTLRVDIAPKAIVANGIVASDRIYNADTSVSVNTNTATLSGVVAGDLVVLQRQFLTGQMADRHAGNDKPVTVSGFNLRGSEAANYSVTSGAVNVDIARRTVTPFLSRTGSTDRIYDGTTSASVSPSVSFVYPVDNIAFTSDAAQYDNRNVLYDNQGNPAFKTITAGNFALSGDATNLANYVLGSTSATTTGRISPKPLTLTGVSAVNRVYNGNVNVDVLVQDANVDRAGVIGADVVNVSVPANGAVVGTMADKRAGTQKLVTVPNLSLTGTDAGNYTLGGGAGVRVDIAPKGITSVYTGVDRIYNGSTWVNVTSTTSDVLPGDQVTLYSNACGANLGNCGIGTFSGANAKDVGQGKAASVTGDMLWTGADVSNYVLLNGNFSNPGTTTANVTPKPITVAFTGGTKVYDRSTEAPVSLNRGGSGIVGNDVVTTTQTAVFTVAGGGANVGQNKAVAVSDIALGGAGASNYTLVATTAVATASVTAKAVTLSGIAASNRVYDGTTLVQVQGNNVGSSGFIAGDDVRVEPPAGGFTTGSIPDKNVGLAKPVTVTGLSLAGQQAGNYLIDASGSGITVDIARRPVTVAYTGIDRVYNGGVTAQVTSSTADLIAGDVVTISQSAVFVGDGARNVGQDKAIAVSNIALGGAGAANYLLANTTAQTFADITARGITVAYLGSSRVYNGLGDLTAPVQGTSPQLVAGDIVGFSQTAVFAGDGSAGNDKPVNVSNIALTGANAANYSLQSTTATTTASVTRRPVAVSGITAQNRVYDGTATVQVTLGNVVVDPNARVGNDQVDVVLPGQPLTTGTAVLDGRPDRNAGTNKPVAVDGLGLTGAQAANYMLAGTTATVNITPKPVSATYSAVDRVYDGSTDAAVSGTLDGVLAADLARLGVQASGAFTGAGARNAGADKAVSVSGGFLTGLERDNYLLSNSTGSTTASILQRLATVSFVGQGKVYDGTAAAFVTGTAGNRVAGDNLTLTQSAVFTGDAATARRVGNNKPVSVSNIALAGDDAANYRLDTNTATTTASITPKPITVAGLEQVVAQGRVYDGTNVVTVNVPAGVPLTPRSDDIIAGDDVTVAVPGNGVVSGTLQNKNAGVNRPVRVDGLLLSGVDAVNYSILGTSGIVATISPRPISAVYSGQGRAYDGTVQVSIGGSSAGVLPGDVVSFSGQGVFTGVGAKNVGNNKAIDVLTASLGGVDGGNYLLLNPAGTATGSISPRAITPSYLGGSKVYDGTTTATVSDRGSGFIAGDDVRLTQTARFANKNAGNDKAINVTSIGLAGGDAFNYRLSQTTASTAGTIEQRPVGILGLTGVTAVDRPYDGTTQVVVNIAASGQVVADPADLIQGDSIVVNVPQAGAGTGTIANKNAGLNKAVTVDGLSLSGTDAGNYRIAAAAGVKVDISRRTIAASFTGVDKVYDGTVAASVTGSSGGLIAGDVLAISGSGVFTGVGARNAGSNKPIDVTGVQLAGADAGNYQLDSNTGTASANILRKTVDARYTTGSKVYDGSVDAVVAGTLDGLVAGDVAGLSQTARFTGAGAKNVGQDKPVEVTGITLNGQDAGNYQLAATTVVGQASIVPRPLGLLGLSGISAVDRVYDGTTAVTVNVGAQGAVTPNPTDLVPGDVVGVSLPGAGTTSGTMADKHAGSAKPVLVSGLVLTGADAANYSLQGTANVTVNIATRPLTASWTGVDKVYDGSTAASVIGAGLDLLAGDLLTIAGSGVFTGDGAKNAGVGKLISVSAGQLSGLDARNYTLANPSGSASATISRREVGAVYTGGTRVYDGTTVAPVSGVVDGLVAGDVLNLAQTAVFTGASARMAGDNKPVAVSGVALSGADSLNYSLRSDSAATTASITPRGITVTGLGGLSAVDRVYDGTRTVVVNVGAAGSIAPDPRDLIAGDVVTVTGGAAGTTTGTMVDKHAGQAKTVAVDGLTLAGADAANYTIIGTAGLSVNIARRSVQLSGVTARDRVYDATTLVQLDALNPSLSGVLAGDDFALGGGALTARMANKNVGQDKPVTIEGLGFAGADARNYSVQGADSLRVNIAPRDLSLTASVLDKVYDGTRLASVGLADNRLSGDTLEVAATDRSFADKNAGIGKLVTVSGFSLTGSDAGNYRLGQDRIELRASITPADLVVRANNLAKVYGDGFSFTGTEFTTSGLVVGETIGQASLSSEGAAARAGVSALPYRIVASGVSGGSFDPANYRITLLDGSLAVTPRPLTVTAQSVVRETGSPNPSPLLVEAAASDLVNGDTVAGGTVVEARDSTGAPGGTVIALVPSNAEFSAGSASNYSIRYVNGLLVVLPKAPRTDDGAGSAGGEGDGQLALNIDAREIERALGELLRQGAANDPVGPANAPSPSSDLSSRLGDAAGLMVQSSDGSTRIRLADLLRLPLLSYDPELRRLMFGNTSPR